MADLLNMYKKNNILKAEIIGRGAAWLDAGTIEDFYRASSFVENIEKRQGLKIACLEEIAWRMGFISTEEARALADELVKSGYGQYIHQQLNHGL